jgi:HTH-type transcriptional regulator/antitoxin HipB
MKKGRKTISGGNNMDDLQRAIAKRKSRDPEFAKTFDKGYEEFKIGVVLKEARKNAGLTQEALADKLHTKKSAISRIENHSEDIRLSTLHHYAEAVGKKIQVSIL